MATNFSTSFTSDVEAYIANETLPLARRRLVAYRFGDPLKLPKGRGVQYSAARWNRLPLPFAPISEGVPPQGQAMTVTMVSATAVQWGDKVTITDIAEMTIKHPMFQIAKELCTLAVSETLERNTYNALMGGTQVNYVNSRGSRYSLVAGDVLNIHEFNRMDGSLETLGAPRFMGDEQTDKWEEAESGGARASSDPRGMPHYAAIIHTLCVQDVRENSTFVLASSYSDINKLYNAEIGELSGIRFCSSNMVPFWTGYALVTGTGGSAGSLANGPYYLIVTGQDTQNQYESYVAQVSASISVSGPNGSISFTTPNVSRLHLQCVHWPHQLADQSCLVDFRADDRAARRAGDAATAQHFSRVDGCRSGADAARAGIDRRHRLPDLHFWSWRLRSGDARRNQVHLPRQGR